jgi:deoxycytidylate deaminase
MKLVFSKGYPELQFALAGINGTWDESQPNKKVFRLQDGILNWYESTGTLQFQGKDPDKTELERLVRNILFPGTVAETPVSPSPVVSAATTVHPGAAEVQTDTNAASQYLLDNLNHSELIIGIVSSVGTETSRVVTALTNRLSGFGYLTEEIKVSSLIHNGGDPAYANEYDRIKDLMHRGDLLREKSQDNGILAYGAAKKIKEARGGNQSKLAYVINSLKHPDEVHALRKIYGQGFYLIGVHADEKRRIRYLTEDKGISSEHAVELTSIDEDEKITHGQRTRDTYHLSDFFLSFGSSEDYLKNSIQRFLELIFGNPYLNPTFDEYAMFMAFSSSVRSGDLSRQVGSIIARDNQILATGANECPSAGGGLYWAQTDKSGKVVDIDDGKDYMRGEDSNKSEQGDIIRNILGACKNISELPESALPEIEKVLSSSRISDLTEFGRVVHAEMDALLSCARAGIDCHGAILYNTTFPCHSCAKHIIAAGLSRVVYVEPYPKSKALDFHSDSIDLQTSLEGGQESERVVFQPFTGVGARRFLDFFSMSLGTGARLRRKKKDGTVVDWSKEASRPRVLLVPSSYLEIEDASSAIYKTAIHQVAGAAADRPA